MSRKYYVITGALVVVSLIIGFSIGDSTATDRANKLVDASVAIKMANEQGKTKTVSTTAKVAKTDTEVTTKVGVTANSGSWNIKVLDAHEATTIQGGSSDENKTTKEKYIVVKLQMRNITKSPAQYDLTEFKLENMKDKVQYDSNLDASGAANGNETIYKQNGDFFGVYDGINPNMPKQTYIIFEVPKDFIITDGVMVNTNNSADSVEYNIK